MTEEKNTDFVATSLENLLKQQKSIATGSYARANKSHRRLDRLFSESSVVVPSQNGEEDGFGEEQQRAGGNTHKPQASEIVDSKQKEASNILHLDAQLLSARGKTDVEKEYHTFDNKALKAAAASRSIKKTRVLNRSTPSKELIGEVTGPKGTCQFFVCGTDVFASFESHPAPRHLILRGLSPERFSVAQEVDADGHRAIDELSAAELQQFLALRRRPTW